MPNEITYSYYFEYVNITDYKGNKLEGKYITICFSKFYPLFECIQHIRVTRPFGYDDRDPDTTDKRHWILLLGNHPDYHRWALKE